MSGYYWNHPRQKTTWYVAPGRITILERTVRTSSGLALERIATWSRERGVKYDPGRRVKVPRALLADLRGKVYALAQLQAGSAHRKPTRKPTRKARKGHPKGHKAGCRCVVCAR